MHDFDTPQGRLAASQTLSPADYNKAIADHHNRSVVATVNGYPIQPVSSRFGRLFMVVGTGLAFFELEDAKTHALSEISRA